MEQARVFDIQRFSTHDGPGIRTTVFFKGCPLSCAWCHNPESQHAGPELLFDGRRCVGCGACVRICPRDAVRLDPGSGRAATDRGRCIACGACVDACIAGAREVAEARACPLDELLTLLLRDRPFYERSGGGVTLSGGECLVQDPDYLEELCRALRAEEIHVAIDTCGYAPHATVERLLPSVDLWLFDLKLMDEAAHVRCTGRSNAPILKNLAFLLEACAPVNIRIPIVGMVNDDDAALYAIMEYLEACGAHPPVSLLPYHETGRAKYARLGRGYEDAAFAVPTQERMEHLQDLLVQQGFAQVEIGG